MKVIAFRSYGAPDVLRIEDFDLPVPGPTEVRIRIKAVAVTSSDMAFRKGDPWIIRLFNGWSTPKQPVLGTELSGVVESVGSEVTRFSVGDEVYAATGDSLGGYAEYLCLPEDGAIALKPSNATFDEAAALCEGVLTALPFLRDEGGLEAGQRVLINGASGSIGTAAVQIAKLYGAHVTGVCSSRNVDLVRSLGADEVLDYTQTDFTESDQTWDVVFDTVGKSDYARARRVLAPGGVFLSPVLSMGILFQSLWSTLFHRTRAKIAFTGLRDGPSKSADLAWLKGRVEAGELQAVIEQRFGMDQIVDAHRYVETGHKVGNAILQVA